MERMGADERRRYLKLMGWRYGCALWSERTNLPCEMVAITVLRRESLLWLLRDPTLERAPAVHHRTRTLDNRKYRGYRHSGLPNVRWGSLR